MKKSKLAGLATVTLLSTAALASYAVDNNVSYAADEAAVTVTKTQWVTFDGGYKLVGELNGDKKLEDFNYAAEGYENHNTTPRIENGVKMFTLNKKASNSGSTTTGTVTMTEWVGINNDGSRTTLKSDRSHDVKDPGTIDGYTFKETKIEGPVKTHYFTQAGSTANTQVATMTYYKVEADGKELGKASGDQAAQTYNGYKLKGDGKAVYMNTGTTWVKTFYYESTSSSSNTSSSSEGYRWGYLNGKTYLYDPSNNPVTGLKTLDDKTYYFDINGVMQTGLIETGGRRYYFTETGKKAGELQLGWVKVNDTWYYISEKGALKTGLFQNGDEIYYLDKGVQKTGLVTVEGKYYYLNEDGSRKTGLIQDTNNKWYYITETGERLTGLIKEGDKRYFLREDGTRRYGSVVIDGETIQLTGVDTSSNIKPGWNKVDGKWYYYNANKEMQRGWVYDGGWYYMNPDGSMRKWWVQVNNRWYYMDGSGKMVTGWMLDTNNKWYFFNSSGAMEKGWAQIGGQWYHFNDSGAMETGWVKVSGKWYYFNNSGAMLTNTTTPDGYTVNANGEWV